MVRLLLKRRVYNVVVDEKFQSHNGAIAALWVSDKLALQLQFQSHNGAIAALYRPLQVLITSGFNPTMVRLLQFQSFKRRWLHMKFQSHNGAIAAGEVAP